jgi:membrane associated rhomboid family serine protease
LGSALALGILARLCCFGPVVGASGAIFAVITIAAMLMPAAQLVLAYGAVFPFSVLIGLFRRPKYGIFWFFCGGEFSVRAFWCLIFIPILEILAMVCALWVGGSVWNLGHLLGMACGVIAVLLLPTRITMRNRARGYGWAGE